MSYVGIQAVTVEELRLARIVVLIGREWVVVGDGTIGISERVRALEIEVLAGLGVEENREARVFRVTIVWIGAEENRALNGWVYVTEDAVSRGIPDAILLNSSI